MACCVFTKFLLREYVIYWFLFVTLPFLFNVCTCSGMAGCGIIDNRYSYIDWRGEAAFGFEQAFRFCLSHSIWLDKSFNLSQPQIFWLSNGNDSNYFPGLF